jgi:hypothetical protein
MMTSLLHLFINHSSIMFDKTITIYYSVESTIPRLLKQISYDDLEEREKKKDQLEKHIAQ